MIVVPGHAIFEVIVDYEVQLLRRKAVVRC